MKKVIGITSMVLALTLAGCGTPGKPVEAAQEEKPAPQEKKPLVLYVVRHGQTIFNLMDRVQGISDGILTEKGIQGAVNMGKGLAEVPFAAVYSSDLARASETARYAVEQNKATKTWEIKERPELREVSFGIYEGDPNYVMYQAFGADLGLEIPETATDIRSASQPILDYYEGNFMRFLEGLADYNKRIDTQYHISEDASEVYARLDKGIQDIIAENPLGGNIMLVAHGQSINFLLQVLKVDTQGAPLGNSSVTKIKYENGLFTLDGPVGDMSYAERGASQ